MNFRSFFTLLFEDLSSKLPILLKQFPNENEKSIEQAADADPTPNKKFITWILKLKSINNIILPEDTEKIKETLLDFLKLSNTGKWKADKNILSYKTYGALAKTVDSFKDITHIKIDKPLAENDKRIPIKTIGNITVYKITDKETLMKWSAEPMKWCVKEERYAELYLKKGPLYMFFKNDEPYVLCHFETGQIKDQWDSGIDKSIAEELYPFLKNAFKNFKIEEGTDFHVFLELPEILDEDKRYILLGKHILHEDGSVSCEGNVNFHYMNYKKLPFNFREVKGDFNCRRNELTTLEGAPKIVGGNFRCSNNLLISLKGGPEQVGGTFDCSANNLTTLEGAPQKVGEDFVFNNNTDLISLKGCPQTVKNFICHNNYKLINLEGGPQKVKGYFSIVGGRDLISLRGSPKEVNKHFHCRQNHGLISLEGCPQKIGGNFVCEWNVNLQTLKGAPKSVGGKFQQNYNRSLKDVQFAPHSENTFQLDK